MGLNDGKKIWDHLQRFAEYSDLKDLYQKCIPQLAKFEQKMIDYTNDYNRIEGVIGEFDKQLLTKTSKISFEEFQ